MDQDIGKAVVGPVDVSSFLVLEASGDSELDSIPVVMANDGYYEYDDDDAESCSCGFYETSCVSDLHLHVGGYDDLEDKGGDQRYPGEFSGMLLEHKSVVSVDSSDDESLDETEKNRLFWEACLAS